MPSKFTLPPASAAQLHADWRYLCRTIGARPAGDTGERLAAEYLERRFTDMGLSVAREPFPCRSLVDSHASVAVRVGNRWRSVDSLRLMNSASTPGGRPVEGDLVWMAFPESQHRLRPGSLRGKILVLFGQLLSDTRAYRQLLAARPAAILPIDDRQPFTWPIQNAMLPDWAQRFGSVPAAAIAYQTAWQWRAHGLTRARVAIMARYQTRPSGNVVATLPGSAPDEPAILFGAHHDTPLGLVGADDNASGVVSLLELARILAAVPQRRRTFVFASFGTEEQLSVGAAAYVARHRRELSRLGLVVNFDSIASHLGHNHLFHSGQKGLGAFFQAELERRGYDLELNGALNPFSDHFPFTAYGVPAVWFYRSNTRGANRWQHHSGTNRDSLANVSAGVVCGLLDALAPIVLALSEAKTWPFPRKLTPALAAQTAAFAYKWYGMKV
jgi:aminopeptidase YwaD